MSKEPSRTTANRFIVIRHGSNAANQSLTLRRVLGTVPADNAVHARRVAARRWTCYANQHFEIVSVTDLDDSHGDLLEARTQDALYETEVGEAP